MDAHREKESNVGYHIYNKDCLDVLKNIPDNSIDLVVTDCPYKIVSGGCTNVPRKDEPSGIFNRRLAFTQQNAKSGKLFDFNDIQFKDWLPDVYRILKPDTHCYIMINSRNLKELQQECENIGFKFQQLLVWDKGNVTPNRYYLNSCEFILMLRKGKAKNINNMGTKNVLKISNIIGNKRHPTQKPVALLEYLIKTYTNEGDLVLDNCMGSGSTGIACLNTNRNFLGMELDENYFNIAKERIEKRELELKTITN